MKIPQQFRAASALVFLCVLWGTSFPLTKTVLDNTGVFTFLSVRFLLGAAALYPFVRKGLKAQMLSTRRAGAILGFWMFLGFILQAGGMKFTTASMSGFLTGTLVVMVPLLAGPLLKDRIRLRHLAAALSALAGVFILTRPDSLKINIGDVMTLGCAFSFAMQMIYVQKYGTGENSGTLAFWQVLAVGVLCLPIAGLYEGFRGLDQPIVWAYAGYAAVFCTAIAFYLQCRFQPQTTAQAAALIYSLEPVFASLFAYFTIGEAAPNLLGAGLILAGMTAAEWKSSKSD